MPHPCMSLHHQDVTMTDRVEDLSFDVDLEAEALSHFNRAKIRKLEREIDHLTAILDVDEQSKKCEIFSAHLEGDFCEYFLPRNKRELVIGRGDEAEFKIVFHIPRKLIVNKFDFFCL